MASTEKTRSVLILPGKFINEALSFIVFIFLDLLDFFLCFAYKIADCIVEAERKPCYCSSSKEAITNSGKIYVSELGESKIVCLSARKLQLEDISETLFSRPSLLSELSNLTVSEIKRLKVDQTLVQSCEMVKKGNMRSYFTVNSTIFEMLEGKMGAGKTHRKPRWSDCDCQICTHWTSSSNDTLFVRAEAPRDKTAREDVLFIHGFISSSAFWTETLFPNFSNATKSAYRLFAVDLLGFGRSPKPADSLYTLREHLEMIERSVLEPHKVKSFHIVAHSLGCILALALAVKFPGSVKSLTLLAPVSSTDSGSYNTTLPNALFHQAFKFTRSNALFQSQPYYPVPKGEQAAQYVMRRIAPRRVWPPIAMGASIACWYEHISRTACILVAKNHRLWEFLTKLITRNRMRTYLMEGFFCHTHNAAWHTLHNIICGSGGKMEGYLDLVRDKLKCSVNIFHGRDDQLIPIECSLNVQAKIPRSKLKIIEKKDHITIVVGRQKDFAGELEQIWRDSSAY